LSRRNNRARTSAPAPFVPEVANEARPQVDTVSPTEFVVLPSGGRLYPPGHPFYMRDEIEIKFMTAKHEDILSSQSLITRGVVLDRLLENLIVDDVDVESLLPGDRNAVFLASRITAYGSDYASVITCPQCGTKNETDIDLNSFTITSIPEDIELTENGTFILTLRSSGVEVEVKSLNVKERQFLTKNSEAKRKNNLPETSRTDFLKMAIVSVNGETNKSRINSFIGSLPAGDSLQIRKVYSSVSPDIDTKQDYHCSSCSKTTALEVPLGLSFFWPF